MRSRALGVIRQGLLFARLDERAGDLRGVLAGRGHFVAGIGFEGEKAVVDEDGEVVAELGEIEVAFEAVEVDVAGVVEGVGVEVLGVEVADFVEAEAEVALVDDVVGGEAICEAATVGLAVDWVTASAVCWVALDPEAEAAGFRGVGAVGEGVQGVFVEVVVDLSWGVERASHELTVGCVFEY